MIPTTGPNDLATADLVKRIRTDREAIQADTGATILVGGTTAFNIDTSDKLAASSKWAWGADLLGITAGETISFQPIIVLAIIFGMSSDYQVFVVSWMNEELSRTDDPLDRCLHRVPGRQ